MKKILFALCTLMLNSCTCTAQEKFGPTPTKEQLAWHDKEYYLFMHLHNTQFWQTNGLVYGSLQLKNLRVEDIKNLSIG